MKTGCLVENKFFNGEIMSDEMQKKTMCECGRELKKDNNGNDELCWCYIDEVLAEMQMACYRYQIKKENISHAAWLRQKQNHSITEKQQYLNKDYYDFCKDYFDLWYIT